MVCEKAFKVRDFRERPASEGRSSLPRRRSLGSSRNLPPAIFLVGEEDCVTSRVREEGSPVSSRLASLTAFFQHRVQRRGTTIIHSLSSVQLSSIPCPQTRFYYCVLQFWLHDFGDVNVNISTHFFAASTMLSEMKQLVVTSTERVARNNC